jgi:hypothetical protein
LIKISVCSPWLCSSQVSVWPRLVMLLLGISSLAVRRSPR